MSVDEVMLRYYGKHADKQYIRGKPVRFGFKLCASCASNGTLLHVEPYCRVHTNIADHGFCHGPNIILDMVSETNLQKGQHVVCDNYFLTVPLLKELTRKGIVRRSLVCKTSYEQERKGYNGGGLYWMCVFRKMEGQQICECCIK